MPEVTPISLKNWQALNTKATQVLICDLQSEIAARSKTTAPEAIAQSADVLCGIARVLAVPVTFSVVPEGDKPPRLISQLQPYATEANTFARTNVNPFLDESSTAYLAAARRGTLVLAGFATEAVVLHTALSAIHHGYNTIVALDACGGMSQATENAALQQIRDCGGIVSSVTSVATALAPDFTTEEGKQMFAIVQTLRLA